MSSSVVTAGHRTLATGLGFTEGPLWTVDGRLLVTSVSRGRVVEIDLDDGGVLGSVETGGGPNGLAQDRHGGIWVAQNGARMMPSRSTLPPRPGLQRIDLAAGVVHDAPTSELLAPNDLVEGPDGRIWFTDPSHDGPGAVYAHDTATGVTEALADGVEYPNGLVVADDRLILAETRTGRLLRYRWDGTRLHTDGALTTLPDGGADGLALGPDGLLYVAVPRADRIAVLDLDGTERQSVSFDGPAFPTNLCFAGALLDVLVVTAAKGGRVLALDAPVPPTPGAAVRATPPPTPPDTGDRARGGHMAVSPDRSGPPTTVQGVIDGARLTPRYWRMAVAVLFSEMLEYFDFFLIGFVVSLIAKPWHLTYGASAVLLLSSGVGAIVGSMLWGYLSDRYGRRPLLIAAIAAAAIGTGVSAAAPVGAWQFLAVFRFLVGVGVGGSVVTGSPLLIELTPTRHRTLLGGFMTSAFIPIGTLVAGAVAASLSDAIGFRGLLLVGLAPAVVGLLAIFVVPESPLW